MPLSQDELDMMFRPEEIRTANRGQVELFTNIYFSQGLAEFGGEKVRVGYDLHNPEMVLIKRIEPTRVFRRQFILSHATLADSSNWR